MKMPPFIRAWCGGERNIMNRLCAKCYLHGSEQERGDRMCKDGEEKREEPARDHRRSADFEQICKEVDFIPDQRKTSTNSIDVMRDPASRIKALLDADDRHSKEQAVLEFTNVIRQEILNAVADIFETEHQKRRHLDEIIILNRITIGWQFPAYASHAERGDLLPRDIARS